MHSRRERIRIRSKKVAQDDYESTSIICTDSLFDDIFEHLSIKKASSRIFALEKLISLLTTEILEDELHSVSETLQYHLLNSLKNGEPKEVQLTCRCISLIFITIGTNITSDLYSPILSLIETLLQILGTNINISNMVSMIHTYGVISFVWNDNISSSLKFLFEKILKHKKLHSDILSAALESWGFLASKIPLNTLHELVKTYQLPSFIQYLYHDSVDVRIRAGQNIALIYDEINSDDDEFEYNEKDSSDDEHIIIKKYNAQSDYILNNAQSDYILNNDTSNTYTKSKTTTSKSKSKSPNGKTFVDHHSLVQLITELSIDSDNKKNKKDRTIQKHTFRSVLATIENTGYPSEKIKILNQNYIFKGWGKILQFYSLRSLILTGFQLHLEQNKYLQQILNIDIESYNSHKHTSNDEESDKKYDEESKAAKMMTSKQSKKSRHLKRQSQRSKKLSFQLENN